MLVSVTRSTGSDIAVLRLGQCCIILKGQQKKCHPFVSVHSDINLEHLHYNLGQLWLKLKYFWLSVGN